MRVMLIVAVLSSYRNDGGMRGYGSWCWDVCMGEKTRDVRREHVEGSKKGRDIGVSLACLWRV